MSDMAVLCPCSQPWYCHPYCTCISRSFERIGDSDFLEGQGPQGGVYSQLTAIITVGNDQSFPTRGKVNFLAGSLFLAWFQESLLTPSFRQEDRFKAEVAYNHFHTIPSRIDLGALQGFICFRVIITLTGKSSFLLPPQTPYPLPQNSHCS